MTDAYQQLVERFFRLAQLDHATTFLQWDQLVMMPPGGNESRAKALAELATLHHEILTAPLTRELLDMAQQRIAGSMQRRSLREMERVWQRAACLPSELVKAKSLAGSMCEHGWRNQRKNNDWQGFLPNFKEVVRLAREEAQARQDAAGEGTATPYDALLDLYCTGDTSAMINQIFDRLKQELPRLLQQVLARQDKVVPTLQNSYPIDQQEQLNKTLMKCLGFDFQQGRLDVSMHPFSTGGRGDHRITTRFRETDFLDALMATAHETGHAAYETGLPKKWDGLPIGAARNLCLHESQSLLFEKQLFLSRPFFDFFLPHIHHHLPATADFDSGQLWGGCTRVQSSLIRVEADEVTYPMHVILRFEIERDLINGVLEADDIPAVWDELMQKYLGLSTADNYRDGCMQDIHWTDGSFGYFPSYTLGALNSAQLFHAIKHDYPDWRDRLAQGKVDFVRQWLDAAIWRKASSMDSQDILREATGEKTNPRYFLEHLAARYLQRAY